MTSKQALCQKLLRKSLSFLILKGVIHIKKAEQDPTRVSTILTRLSGARWLDLEWQKMPTNLVKSPHQAQDTNREMMAACSNLQSLTVSTSSRTKFKLWASTQSKWMKPASPSDFKKKAMSSVIS
jgi:hypothetical protein